MSATVLRVLLPISKILEKSGLLALSSFVVSRANSLLIGSRLATLTRDLFLELSARFPDAWDELKLPVTTADIIADAWDELELACC